MRQNVEKLHQLIVEVSNSIQHYESAIYRINDPDEIVKIQFVVIQLRQKMKRLELDIQQQKKDRKAAVKD